MAFVKLIPPADCKPLKVQEITRRMRKEFAVVEADKSQGWDHVDEMIAETMRFSHDIPEQREQLEWLREVQEDAVYVSFGDAPDHVAACCVMPDSELFFGSEDEVRGTLRPLVERCAKVLGYELFEGEAHA